MRAGSSAEGNGDNTLFYTCNARARTHAHARVMGVRPAVASVANDRDWLRNGKDETVAPTVARGQTVAATGNRSEAAKIFPLGCSAQAAARGPPSGALQASGRRRPAPSRTKPSPP
jgi:hypothetical protein